MLIERLVKRLFAAQNREQVVRFLKRIKDGNDDARRELRTSGNLEELETQLVAAVGRGWVSIRELAATVDEAEENGNQHVFLFDLTDAGREHITRGGALRHFREAPHDPVEEAYSDLPTGTVLVRNITAEVFLVKEVFTAAYWITRSTTHPSEDEEIIVRERQKQRAMNLLVADTGRSTVEIRIGRIEDRGETRQNLTRRFNDFIARLGRWFDVQLDLVVVPVWDAFPLIQQDRDFVIMPSDRSASATANQLMAVRRRGQHADIRDDPDYPANARTYARSEMRLEWIRGAGDNAEYIPCRISEFAIDEQKFAKVEFRQRIERDALNYVIGRIRHFAAVASGTDGTR
jgi:hypothetical protein